MEAPGFDAYRQVVVAVVEETDADASIGAGGNDGG
jgi:hypothetical protein